MRIIPSPLEIGKRPSDHEQLKPAEVIFADIDADLDLADATIGRKERGITTLSWI